MGKLILVAVLSGLGSAVTVALVLPSAPTSEPVSAERSATPLGAKVVAPDVQALEADLRQLRKRVRALENEPAPSRTTPRTSVVKGRIPPSNRAVVPADGDVAAGAPVAHIVEALESDASPLRRAVQGMIDDTMENRRQEWRAVRRAHGEARDQDRLKGFLKLVDLNDGQLDAVTDALDAERKNIGDEWRKARENMQFEGMRDRMRAHREQTDENLGEVLTAEQLEQWKTYRKENWGRRRR